MSNSIPIYCQWTFSELDLDGNIIQQKVKENIIVLGGRTLILQDLFGLSASSVLALGVGACSTPAVVTDSQLNYELIANPLRKALTNTAGAGLSISDITPNTVTVSCITYYEQITVQAIYSPSDLNINQPFNEYGLFNTNILPSSPTAASGVMLNHVIDPSPITKTSSNQIVVQIVIRT